MIGGLRSPALAAALALGLVVSIPGTGGAQGVPVYDATSVAQLIEQVANQIEQLTVLRSQLESLTGDKGMGLILNSAEDILARHAAESLSSVMDGAITGSGIAGNSGRIAATVRELRETFDLALLPEFLASEFPQDRGLATLGGAATAAMATGEDSYLRANEAMARIDALVPRIDANTDLKASVDFNTRVLIENTQMLNEVLRVLSAQTNALGAQSLVNARDAVASREFMRVNREE